MRYLITVVLLIFVFLANATDRPRNDSIYLNNGNIVTGEIKSLELGKLTYKTDDMGTLKVEWDKLKGVESDQTFLITVQSGTIYYGYLDTSGVVGKDLIIMYEDTVMVKHMDIVLIQVRDKKFIDNINGYINVGYSFIKANESHQLTGDFDAIYRGKRANTEFSSGLIMQRFDSLSATTNQNASITHSRFTFGSFYYGSALGYERNTELNLQARYKLTAFAGNHFIRTNFTQLAAIGGLSGNLEYAMETHSDTRNLEAVIGMNFRTYRYDEPELDLSTSFYLYQSLNDAKRRRFDVQAKVRWEVVKDFFLTLSFYDNFDSKQPLDGTIKNDYGLVSGIEFIF